jgi:hypothetical protein
MKPRAQKITVIIVFLLVLLFGVGQFFARAPIQSTNQQESNAQTGPQATQVVHYTPLTPASSTPVVQGSCRTSSIAAPYRDDAWRCMVGNGVSDPCFEIPGNKDFLLCGANPARPDATSSFALQITKALPPQKVSRMKQPVNWAWLVKLGNGTICSPFTGTLPFAADGEAAEYGCAPQYQGDDRMIFGDLNASTSKWTAEVGTLSASTSTFPPPIIASSVVPVAAVWQ